MANRTTTARTRREELRAEFSRVLRRVLDEHDKSIAWLARVIGTDDTIAQRMCAPEEKTTLGAPDLVQQELDDEIAIELLRWIAEQRRHLVVPAPLLTDRPESDIPCLMAAVKEHSEAMAAASRVFGDAEHRADRAALEAVVREGRESLAATAAVVERAKALLEQITPPSSSQLRRVR